MLQNVDNYQNYDKMPSALGSESHVGTGQEVSALIFFPKQGLYYGYANNIYTTLQRLVSVSSTL